MQTTEIAVKENFQLIDRYYNGTKVHVDDI